MDNNQLPEHSERQAFRSPAVAAAAVARARQDESDLSLVNVLANMTADPESWSALRDAGVVDLFVNMILRTPDQARLSPTPLPSWALPLQGLFNCMVGIQSTPGAFQTPENREAALKILTGSPTICRRLYADQAKICGSQPHDEDLRRFVTLWIQAVWNGAPMLGLPEIPTALKTSHIVNLATSCWVFASTPELRSRAAISLQEVLDQSLKADFDLVLESSGSYEKLIGTGNLALRSPDVIDEGLANNMSLLTCLTGQTVHVEMSRRFAKMKTHWDVLAAVRRQLSRPSDEQSWRVMEYSGMLVVNIVNEAVSPTEELTSLIAYQSLIPLLGGIMLRCAQASRQSASWSSLITLLKHTCTCTSQTCRIRTSPAYVSALRKHLSWRWWPTCKNLHAITAASKSSSQIESAWVILGRMAGLDEITERGKHEIGAGIDGCWWVECVKHTNPPASAGTSNPDLGLRKCSSCKRAQYCTTECQTKDWKGHKKQCVIGKTTKAL